MIEIQTLLVPTDRSETAADALTLGEALARRHGATLHEFHVEIVPPSGRFERSADLVAETIGENRVERTRQSPAPAAAIVAYAAEISADVIVMGTHGRGGWDRAILGSTTDYVLRRAPCPVLTVGPHAEPFARGPVLAAVAFGDDEANVIEAAAGFAHAAGVRLVALHVVEPVVLPAPYAMEFAPMSLDTLVLDARDALNKRLRERVTLPVASEAVVRSGAAEPEVLALAEEIGAGLIVQGTHGRGSIGRALLGSVADGVVRRAPCPVLTIRQGVRPLAVTDRDALTRAEPLAHENWARTLEGLSLYSETAPWAVTVGIVGQDASGTILDGVRLRGLAYDPHDDAIDVMTSGGDHRIARPLAVRLAGGGGSEPFALEVVRRDGARERIEAEPTERPGMSRASCSLGA